MQRNSIRNILLALVIFIGLLPCHAALAQDVDMGAQFEIHAATASITNGGLLGLKIQMEDWAITPKLGFGVTSYKGNVDTLIVFRIGSTFDYYFSDGDLRPYAGGGLLFNIAAQNGTDFWVTIDPHIGLEYWLTDSVSLGGNAALGLGFGELANQNFEINLGGNLSMTYYW